MALCAAPTLMGCLVTDKIDFEVEKDFPPVILDKPNTAFPIGGVIWVDSSQEPNVREFNVIVRDENVNDALEARLRVRTSLNRTPLYVPEQPVQVTGEVEREFAVRFATTEIKQGECNELQLAVSGSFIPPREGEPNPGLFAVTARADDIALASWLVWEGKGGGEVSADDARMIVSTCEANLLEEATQ